MVPRVLSPANPLPPGPDRSSIYHYSPKPQLHRPMVRWSTDVAIGEDVRMRTDGPVEPKVTWQETVLDMRFGTQLS